MANILQKGWKVAKAAKNPKSKLANLAKKTEVSMPIDPVRSIPGYELAQEKKAADLLQDVIDTSRNEVIAQQESFANKVANVYDAPEEIAHIESNIKNKLESERLNTILESNDSGITNVPISSNTPKTKLRTNTFDESMLIADFDENPKINLKQSKDYLASNNIRPDGITTHNHGYDFEQQGFTTKSSSPLSVKRNKKTGVVENTDELLKTNRAYTADGSLTSSGYNTPTNGTPWSSTAKAVLGTAVVGAGICAALSSSRGQQSNAQLYGQQPLY